MAWVAARAAEEEPLRAPGEPSQPATDGDRVLASARVTGAVLTSGRDGGGVAGSDAGRDCGGVGGGDGGRQDGAG